VLLQLETPTAALSPSRLQRSGEARTRPFRFSAAVSGNRLAFLLRASLGFTRWLRRVGDHAQDREVRWQRISQRTELRREEKSHEVAKLSAFHISCDVRYLAASPWINNRQWCNPQPPFHAW
jgi:hypothetical protein